MAPIELRIVDVFVRIVFSLAALVLSMSGAPIAAAHTALSDSDPTAESTVDSPPTAITLIFTEDINPAFVNVVFSGADGRNWIWGDPRVDGPRVSATVQPDAPPAGSYTVGYRVVSADGHPVSGSYTFTIAGVAAGAPSTSAGPGPTTSAPPVAAPAGTDTKTSVITAAVAGLALGAIIAFWQSRKHRRNKTIRGIAPETGRPDDDDEPRSKARPAEDGD